MSLIVYIFLFFFFGVPLGLGVWFLSRLVITVERVFLSLRDINHWLEENEPEPNSDQLGYEELGESYER